MYKPHILFALIVMMVSIQLAAQPWVRERRQLVIGFGTSAFMGDLGGSDDIGTQGPKDFNLRSARPAVHLGYRYHLLEALALKGGAAFGYLYSTDDFTNQHHRNNRNLHFRSPIAELSAQGEYYFWGIQRVGDRYRRITRSPGWVGFNLRTYAFAGVGGFYYEPQGYFVGENVMNRDFVKGLEEYVPADGWYNLRPLRTEGQGYEKFPTRPYYKPFGLVLPFGIGAIMNLTPDLMVSLEYGFRKTFTDYIDDASTTYVDPKVFDDIFEGDPRKIILAKYFANPTLRPEDRQTRPGQQRANPHNDDAYMFLFLNLSYKIKERRFRGRIPGL